MSASTSARPRAACSRCWPRRPLLAGCERPPVETVQRAIAAPAWCRSTTRASWPQAPANQPAGAAARQAGSDGPEGQGRVPERQGAGRPERRRVHAHHGRDDRLGRTRRKAAPTATTENLADDSKYTKVVARRMIEMTQHINADWKPHVAAHRRHLLHLPPRQAGAGAGPGSPPRRRSSGAGQHRRQRPARTRPCAVVGLASLPYDPFTVPADGKEPIRVGGTTAAAHRQRRLDQAPRSSPTALMNHMPGRWA
jgi:photosynthetic reaction center cytochrome c subunit